jgi:hypothetical protein
MNQLTTELRLELEGLGMTTLEQFFDYILESKINGQHTQAKRLYKMLSTGMQGERALFFDYVATTYNEDADTLKNEYFDKAN